jgi:hypothetical protein
MLIEETGYVGETLACRVQAATLLAVHGSAPSDADWRRSLEMVAELQEHCQLVGVVAVSLVRGALPTTHQRTLVSSYVDDRRARIALVGGGATLRMVVRAFSLFYPRTQAFALKELGAALRFAGVRDPERGARNLAEMAVPFGHVLPLAS